MDINAVTAYAYACVTFWLSAIRSADVSDGSIYQAEEELMGLYGDGAVGLDDNNYQVLLSDTEP